MSHPKNLEKDTNNFMHLRKTIPMVGFCAVSVLSSFAFATADQGSHLLKNLACKQKTGIPIDKACGGLKEPLPQISCYLPSDVEGKLQQKNQNVVQRATDIFSWQAFIALNWPAQDMPEKVVWQTWKSLDEVFPPRQPFGSKAPNSDTSACGANLLKLHDQSPNVHNLLDADLQAAVSDATLPATLTDQDGHLTRYNIRINPTMVKYIVEKQLDDATAQEAATSVSFPHGSIVLKAAWREVNDSNDSRFYTTEACVCESEKTIDRKGKTLNVIVGCQQKTMGLVGMHIVTKTKSAPQWIWSTYEQVDNVAVNYANEQTTNPKTGKTQTISKQVPPSYYNPSCKDCPTDKQTPKGVPAQLTRLIPIPSVAPNCKQETQAVDDIELLNTQVQDALRNSSTAVDDIKQLNLQAQDALGNSSTIDQVFQYYELVNTQWAVPHKVPHKVPHSVKSKLSSLMQTDIKAAVPPIVANLTMESYVQQTSTCIGCHSTARTINPEKFVSSDFTFVLSHNSAMPQLQPECRVDPPIIPRMTGKSGLWEYLNWAKITRGYQLVENTYEELPPFTTAKLHCTSCHLKGGGDSNAAWWVPMVKAYDYPATQNLQARINQCFQRSMNGQALCSANTGNTADNCRYDENMIAIVTYMEWLNKKAKNTGLSKKCQGKRGFPLIIPIKELKGMLIKKGMPIKKAMPIKDLTGFHLLQSRRNPVQGQSIYVQKCAVCHGVEGQGRYEHDTYHRPALWGPNSFNYSAGLADTQKMAEFLKANMPLGAGGMLTAQEAWDVGAFINECHCRPGRSLTTDGKPCELNPNCPSPK
jgi:cytochrome c